MCLRKLLSLCHKSGILRVEQSGQLHYGPLGSLLKRNIFNEWLSSLLSFKEFQVFPLEVHNPREEQFLQGPAKDLPAELDSWLNCDELFGPQPPFGYAVYGPCIKAHSAEKAAEYTDFGFLRSLQAWTRLSLVFRCPASRPTHWFYFWAKQRHIWWRKLSSIPSQFSLSGITSSSAAGQGLWVQLNSGQLPLEAVTLWDAGKERGHFVTCQMELEAAVMAHLANSCADKWREGEAREVLQLHSRLAPYQVCMWTEGDDKLQAAAAHLTQQLKARGVSVFLPPAHTPFSKFDEMGIPYTVVLGRSSLANGIAGLRSRDTTLQEQVHIAELTPKLTQYLKI